VLSVFSPTGTASEDYRLVGGSPFLGQGLRLPNAALVDPGIYGAPQAASHGSHDDVAQAVFHPLTAVPVTSAAIDRQASLTITFSAPLDPNNVGTEVRVVDGAGAAITATISASGSQLTIAPPAGGWQQAFFVQLHRGLRAASTTPLSCPLVLPYLVRP
jgi:hypothetical protein